MEEQKVRSSGYIGLKQKAGQGSLMVSLQKISSKRVKVGGLLQDFRRVGGDRLSVRSENSIGKYELFAPDGTKIKHTIKSSRKIKLFAKKDKI